MYLFGGLFGDPINRLVGLVEMACSHFINQAILNYDTTKVKISSIIQFCVYWVGGGGGINPLYHECGESRIGDDCKSVD